MKLRTKNKVNPLFSMSSLTDIIFLLLIFFMLTSTMVAPNAIKLLLPNAKGQTLSNQTVTVSITHDLNYYVAGKKVPYSSLRSEIQRAVAGIVEPTPSVVLNVDKRVDVEHLVGVMKLGNELKVRMILKTKPA